VKNITISVADDVYRAARIRAAETGTSVSALVGRYLASLAGLAVETKRLEAQQRRVQREIKSFRAADRLGRDELHDRAVR
jgi:predicted CopG family antitoxin